MKNDYTNRTQFRNKKSPYRPPHVRRKTLRHDTNLLCVKKSSPQNQNITDNLIMNDDNTNPVLSVCVQTYQHAPYIQKALDSILMQKTNFLYEIIIGEDESTDGTREICQKYALENPNKIRLFLRSRNKVVYVNGNPTGRYNFIQNIKSAKGKYIANCPGDDYWTDPYKLQKQVAILESHPEYAACFHETQLVHEDGTFGKIFGKDAPIILTAEDTISIFSLLHPSSIVFRKDAFFAPDWFYKVVSGDMAFFSILSKTGNFIKIPEIMSAYNKHKAGLSNTRRVKDNLHSDRIILTNYLNAFHEYKYHEKSKKVITFHQEKIKDIHFNSMNHNQIHYEHLTRHRLLNTEFEKEPKVSTPPTMLNDSEIKLLYWLAKDIFTGSGTLVELGSWLGGSTAAFAQGLANNKKNITKNIFSYDNFVWTAWYNRYNLNIAKSVGDSFIDIYLQNINQWKEIINVRHGDVCKLGWHGDPIEILFVDIMKSLETAKSVAHSFFPHLIPGKSLVIHQDFKHFHEFWIHTMTFRLREHLVPVLNIHNAPTIVFKCIKKITSENIEYACSFNTLTENEINSAFQHSIEISKGSMENFIDEIIQAKNKAISYIKSNDTKESHKMSKTANHITYQSDKFLKPIISAESCDLYIIRNAIKEKIYKSLPLFSGKLLDVGCGQMPYKEFILKLNPKISKYIGIDFAHGKYATLKQPDITWDGKNIPLEDNSIDCAMATEVLEHCPNPLATLKEIRRVLGPDGIFFFTVPFLWPLHDAPHDHYRYTPFSLRYLLSEAGFEDIEINALGGWNASLAQMIGLWLKRAPMHDEMRLQMTNQLFPLYQQLIKIDNNIQQNEDSYISPGWSGIAYNSFNNKNFQLPFSNECNSTNLCIVRTDQFVYSETFIEDHIKHISKNTTIVHGEPYPFFDKDKKCIIEPQFIKSSILSQETYIEAFTHFLNKNKFDVILAEFGTVAAKIFKACEQSETPYVVHFHGYDATSVPTLHQFKREYHAFFQSAAALVVVSKAMRDKILECGAPKEKIILNPYGVDISREDLACPENSQPIFLAVGRFVEKKSPHRTIQAFSKTAKAFPHARLIMVGDGPLLNSCQELAENLNILNQVQFAGIHSRRSVAKLMRQSRAFVQHSITATNGDTEGLPLAILEAGAAGLPVISTRHAGIPDAVIEGENGFLVNEGDVETMSEAMLSIAKSPKLAGWMGKKYRQRVVEHFSREKSIQGLQTILEAAKYSKHKIA